MPGSRADRRRAVEGNTEEGYIEPVAGSVFQPGVDAALFRVALEMIHDDTGRRKPIETHGRSPARSPGTDGGAHCIAVDRALLTYDLSHAPHPHQHPRDPVTTSGTCLRPSDELAMMTLLARLIRGEAVAASELPNPGDVAVAALRHGVLPLVHRGLGVHRPGDARDGLRDALTILARNEAAADIIRVAETQRLLRGLHDAGIQVLVFKGGALAFSHYASPHLRPRDDTDILVEESQLPALDTVAAALGYRACRAPDGRLMSHQRGYTRIDRRGIHHNVDVHWRISNRHRYARLFSLEELLARSRALPEHSGLARCPAPVDALLIAALHRAHHRGTDRLVWLYDIHRLLVAMGAGELAELEERVASKGLAAEYQAAVHGAKHFFGHAAGAPPAVATGLRTIDVWRSDLAALPTWRARLALLKEHAFPSADYMRRAGECGNPVSLSFAYLTRGVRGSMKLFRRA